MTAGEPDKKPKFYRDRSFQLGCVGWFVVNGILLFAVTGLAPPGSSGMASLAAVASFLVLVANLGALILFAFRRPRIAGGMLAAFGIALALVIVAGIVLAMACFTAFNPVTS